MTKTKTLEITALLPGRKPKGPSIRPDTKALEPLVENKTVACSPWFEKKTEPLLPKTVPMAVPTFRACDPTAKKPADNSEKPNQIAIYPTLRELKDACKSFKLDELRRLIDTPQADLPRFITKELLDAVVRDELLHRGVPMEPYHPRKDDCQFMPKYVKQKVDVARKEQSPKSARYGEATMMAMALDANPALKQKVLGKVGETWPKRLWKDEKR
jgi:hypothetical protein